MHSRTILSQSLWKLNKLKLQLRQAWKTSCMVWNGCWVLAGYCCWFHLFQPVWHYMTVNPKSPNLFFHMQHNNTKTYFPCLRAVFEMDSRHYMANSGVIWTKLRLHRSAGQHVIGQRKSQMAQMITTVTHNGSGQTGLALVGHGSVSTSICIEDFSEKCCPLSISGFLLNKANPKTELLQWSYSALNSPQLWAWRDGEWVRKGKTSVAACLIFLWADIVSAVYVSSWISTISVLGERKKKTCD